MTNVELIDAVIYARMIFYEYADLHHAKGTEDGEAKARRNLEHAERMDAAIRAAHAAYAPKSHWSDCALHNGPALPTGECDCGGDAPNGQIA
jgi:hypothetical protein